MVVVVGAQCERRRTWCNTASTKPGSTASASKQWPKKLTTTCLCAAATSSPFSAAALPSASICSRTMRARKCTVATSLCGVIDFWLDKIWNKDSNPAHDRGVTLWAQSGIPGQWLHDRQNLHASNHELWPLGLTVRLHPSRQHVPGLTAPRLMLLASIQQLHFLQPLRQLFPHLLVRG